MILIILVGLWALVRGQITILPQLKLVGKQARIYGAAIIFVAFTLLTPLANLVGMLLVSFSATPVVATIATYSLIIFVMLGTAYLCTYIKLAKNNKENQNPN